MAARRFGNSPLTSMNPGRLLRTVRHLSAEQILYSIARRARHEHWRRRPHAIKSRIASAATRLPDPDPHQPAIGRIADLVALLQRTIHPESTVDLRAGRLRIFGHDIPLVDPRRFGWRNDIGEGDSPLRRLTVAYLGWAVPLLASGNSGDLQRVVDAVDSLDAVSWSEPGVFRDLWNPYTASHRLINLLVALHLFFRSGGTAEAEPIGRILHHVKHCAVLIAHDPELDIQANHLFKNWTALATYTAATTGPDPLLPWLTDRLEDSLRQIVLGDGGHAERSPMYHALGLIDVEIVLESGAAPALDGQLRDTAAAMRRALSILTHPDGDIALFNDAWLAGAPAASALGASQPTTGLHTLPETGYARLDGGADVVIFDCGPCALDSQPGHAHADFLSFEMSISGARFIVDPGTATYSSGALRDRSRSAASHNGPYLVDHEPLELWQSFRIGRRGTAGLLSGAGLDAVAPMWCAGWQNGYRQAGVEVRRWLGLWPGQGLAVVDVWLGAEPQRCRSRFLVPARWRSEPSAGAIRFRGAVDAHVQSLSGTLSPAEAASYWPRYGEEAPANAFELRPAICDGQPAATLLVSWKNNSTAISDVMIEHLVRCLIRARPTTETQHSSRKG